MNQDDNLNLHSGFLTFGADPARYLGAHGEIRDAGLRRCPIFSRASSRVQSLIESLMAGVIPPSLLPAIDAYEKLEGKIAWPKTVAGNSGVHPYVAMAALCRRERAPVVLEIQGLPLDVRKNLPWKQTEGFREIVAWANHRYLAVGYEKLGASKLFRHISESDRKRSVKRIIDRVAGKLRAMASEMGVTIDVA